MADESIPEDVARLLERIESYEQLEILLLLHRAPQQEWTADVIGERLNISAPEAESALYHLCALQLVIAAAAGHVRSFRWLPGRPAADETLRKLVRVYDEQRLAVVQMMNAHAIERLRTAAIRTFADAFLVGRKKKDG